MTHPLRRRGRTPSDLAELVARPPEPRAGTALPVVAVGMTPPSPAAALALAALATGLAAYLALSGTGARRHRLRATRTVPPAPQPRFRAGGAGGTRVRRRSVATFAALAVALLLGSPWGWPAALVAAVVVERRLAQSADDADRRRHRRLVSDLPIAADLLAACLQAGAAPEEAATAVAAAIGGPLGDELRAAAAAVKLGGDPARCWMALARHPEMSGLARALARSGVGGAPPAERIARIADEYRDRRRLEFAAMARRASVRATLPLGGCFLPAFLLIGVVPVVIGLAAPLLSGT